MTEPLRIQGDVYTSPAGITIEGTIGLHGAGQGIVLGLSSGNNIDDGTALMELIFRDWNGRFVRSLPHLTPNLSEPPIGAAREILFRRHVDSRTCGIIAKDLARTEDQQHYPLGGPKEPPMHKRAVSVDSIPHPPSSALCRSPLVGSLPLGQFFRKHNAKSEETEIPYSAAGSLSMDGKAVTYGLGLILKGSQEDTIVSGQPGGATSREPSCDEYESTCDSETMEEPPLSMFLTAALERCDTDDDDDDAYLFTDPPPERPQLDPNHPFAQVKDELIDFALQELSHCVPQGPSHTGKRVRHKAMCPRRKRFKPASDAQIESERLTDSEDEMAHVECRRREIPPAFACPFYVRNPQAHQSCLNRAHLRSIKDVKQHLWVAHRLPYFCPTCRQIFGTARACDLHVRDRSCTLRTSPDFEGVTEVQMQALARRSHPALSAEEQWFAVWNIVFPEEGRPARAVLWGNVESAVCAVRDYWARNGERTVAKFLEAKKLREYDEVQDEERGLAALYAVVLEQMVDEVVAGFGGDEVTPATQASRKAEEVLAALRGLYSWAFL